MAKIGIVTLWGNINYGNRLQNYAVEQLIIEAGYEPVTLVPSKNRGITFRTVKERVYEYIRAPYLRKRKRAFDEFNAKYINGVSFDHETECSALLCGSDQIWNYSYPEFSREMFLSFAAGRPTASISASFGVDTIPASLQSYYKGMLEKIETISVREESGASIVHELTGREAIILADPTLAIDSKKWTSFASDMGVPHSSYVLTYFLGHVPDNLNQRIRNELNTGNIIALNDIKNPKYYSIDPRSFLELIIGADIVLTDSFHGSVFSILFGKRFVLFDRMSPGLKINSRTNSLLNMFDIGCNYERSLNSLSDCKYPSKNTSIILKNERAKMQRFISNVLYGL